MNNLTLKLDSPENVWLTGCTHWGHANILGFCNRPYETIEEMNADLIKIWNDTVPSDGIVIHHGDLTLGSDAMVWLEKLNGNIYIIPGNHDHRWLKNWQDTTRIKVLPPIVSIEFNVGNKWPEILVCCHYSMQVWDRSPYGSIHTFSHSHSNLSGIGKSIDVGVDNWGMHLPSYETIKHIFSTEEPLPTSPK